MRTQFSTWQYLNYSKSQDQAAVKRALAGACVHMEFVTELYHDKETGTSYMNIQDTQLHGSRSA